MKIGLQKAFLTELVSNKSISCCVINAVFGNKLLTGIIKRAETGALCAPVFIFGNKKGFMSEKIEIHTKQIRPGKMNQVEILSPMARISVKEYDELRDRAKYITDPSLISLIDKLEFFVKELRNTLLENYNSEQAQLFETEDAYGNDIIQGPKLERENLQQNRQ